EMEDRLANLRAPRWPATFPPLDADKVKRGADVYVAQDCLKCHAIATPGKRQDVKMTDQTEVGTDIAMAYRAAKLTASTGRLEGANELVLPLPHTRQLGPTENRGTITFNAVVGAILSPIPPDWFRNTPSS